MEEQAEALLLADLQLLLKTSPIFDSQIKFLLEMAGCQKYHGENDRFYSYWYQEESEDKRS